ncbi:MAG: hypothetical protein J3K34DRAFT_270011 [Monoraphidium minutum]|nr:MAG: hypothetical protein J3K34DRAFT_270011 [Monoraphidium minutum]
MPRAAPCLLVLLLPGRKRRAACAVARAPPSPHDPTALARCRRGRRLRSGRPHISRFEGAEKGQMPSACTRGCVHSDRSHPPAARAPISGPPARAAASEAGPLIGAPLFAPALRPGCSPQPRHCPRACPPSTHNHTPKRMHVSSGLNGRARAPRARPARRGWATRALAFEARRRRGPAALLAPVWGPPRPSLAQPRETRQQGTCKVQTLPGDTPLQSALLHCFDGVAAASCLGAWPHPPPSPALPDCRAAGALSPPVSTRCVSKHGT